MPSGPTRGRIWLAAVVCLVLAGPGPSKAEKHAAKAAPTKAENPEPLAHHRLATPSSPKGGQAVQPGSKTPNGREMAAPRGSAGLGVEQT